MSDPRMIDDPARIEEEQAVGWRSFLMPVGAIVALVGLAMGIWFLVDRQASANVAALLYDVVGDSTQAEALRGGSGNKNVAKLVLAAVALVVGVGGIWLFYAGLNAVVMRLGARWRGRLLPWVFVGPALALLAIYLVWPAVSTIVKSLTEGDGLDNYVWALTTPENHDMYFNNFLWLVVGVAGAVGFGLLIAGLLDRVKYESVAKTFIFLPLAISLVGASVIWRFVYAWKPASQPQYGLLNAIWTGLGQEPVPWIQTPEFHINTFALIVILIWLQTGFAMVVLSAAIKGVPTEITEAARLDGASERQLLPAHHRAHDQGLPGHRHDHHGHRRPQDLRHRLRHDRRPLRHRRDRATRCSSRCSSSSTSVVLRRSRSSSSSRCCR